MTQSQIESDCVSSIHQLMERLHSSLSKWSGSEDKEPYIEVITLSTKQDIAVVRWESELYMTGIDVMKCILLHLSVKGTPIQHRRKFEEGVFSDLRALKPGSGCVLEESRSPFLFYLQTNHRLRTVKRQKIFFLKKLVSMLVRISEEAQQREHAEANKAGIPVQVKPLRKKSALKKRKETKKSCNLDDSEISWPQPIVVRRISNRVPRPKQVEKDEDDEAEYNDSDDKEDNDEDTTSNFDESTDSSSDNKDVDDANPELMTLDNADHTALPNESFLLQSDHYSLFHFDGPESNNFLPILPMPPLDMSQFFSMQDQVFSTHVACLTDLYGVSGVSPSSSMSTLSMALTEPIATTE